MTNTPISFDALESAYDEDKIENGAWMDFIGPEQEPWTITVDGQTYQVRAKVRSMLSTKYDKHMDRMQTGAASRSRKLKGEEQRRQALLKEMKENQPKSFAALVSEMENISKARLGTIVIPESDLLHFALQPRNQKWVQQVLDYAADDANYARTDAAPAAPGNASGAVAQPPADPAA